MEKVVFTNDTGDKAYIKIVDFFKNSSLESFTEIYKIEITGKPEKEYKNLGCAFNYLKKLGYSLAD